MKLRELPECAALACWLGLLLVLGALGWAVALAWVAFCCFIPVWLLFRIL